MHGEQLMQHMPSHNEETVSGSDVQGKWVARNPGKKVLAVDSFSFPEPSDYNNWVMHNILYIHTYACTSAGIPLAKVHV